MSDNDLGTTSPATEQQPDTAGVPKSEKQLRKESKRLEKLEKFKSKPKQVFSAAKSTLPAQPEAKARPSKNANSKLEVKYQPNGKKDVESLMPESYDPEYVEAGWYDWWMSEKVFEPRENCSERFVMIMPPPNVTGTLHLGHALTCTLEDSLARFHRMKGRSVLWLPGCDHAGIATQVVVEKWLWKSERKSRHDIGRRAFVGKIWDWKHEKGDRIYEQIKEMGASCDWSRVLYTMDKRHSYAVNEAFIRLFERGQIYRDSRIVNWSTVLRSVISDVEVEKVAIKGRTQLSVPGYDRKITFGLMTRFAYKLADDPSSSAEIVVATTRLETMLGDVAIAVNPRDARYVQYHGKCVTHPFFVDRRVVVVADESAQIDFGTGAVKISPGHDQMDFDVAKKFDLPIFGVLDDDGCIKRAAGFGKFGGLKRFDARRAVEAELNALGLLRGEKQEVEMVLPMCSRSKDVIEPMVKPQWFLSMAADSCRAAALIEAGREVKVFPERHRAECVRMLRQPRDWCLSRQLWWGHRIPAFRMLLDGGGGGTQEQQQRWVCGHDENDARARHNIPPTVELARDDDVLDTWFSSALLPFSALGWPKNTPDLERYFPGNLLETGHDIVFFWVMRMIIMSMKLLDGSVPFREVYLHGLIRDSHGVKMSKSLGNVIDPIDVIRGASLEKLGAQLTTYNLDEKEIQRALKTQKADYPKGIPACGTDALRFTFANYSSQSTDINLDVLRIQGYRFFCNKIWNAFKYCIPFIKSAPREHIDHPPPCRIEHPLDRWILSRLSCCVDNANAGFTNYEFATVSSAVHSFFLYEFCDLYIEHSKGFLYDKDNQSVASGLVSWILGECMDVILRLMHPIMPFITEELYQRLPGKSTSIALSKYPESADYVVYRDEKVEAVTSSFRDCLQEIRSFRSICEMPPKQSISFVDIRLKPSLCSSDFEQFGSQIMKLAKCEQLRIGSAADQCDYGKDYVPLIFADGRVYVKLEGMEVEKVASRLQSKIGQIEEQANKIKREKGRDNYAQTVPLDVQKHNDQKLMQLLEHQEHLVTAFERLSL